MGTLRWLPLALAAPALVQAAQFATLDEAAKRADRKSVV